ncbi:nitroreductase family protein [Ligilactobacillus sp.]|uniref:nitroreductase family protein n=1 Tax=Ligilactobacillus sp. TaxID=2767921 RepID=UPI002FE188BA
MNNAIEFLRKRRSIYAIGKNVEMNNEEITELIEGAVRNSPTAFNSQTVRAVITFGESSDRVWDIVLAELRKVIKDDDAFAKTKDKIATFRAGIGTVLYFTETATVRELEQDFPLYAANFADWAEQGIGGAQQAVWEVLAENDIGASIQHYNPLIDDAIMKQFDLPESWRLRAEMPFGSIEAPAGDKEFLEDDVRFRVFD